MIPERFDIYIIPWLSTKYKHKFAYTIHHLAKFLFLLNYDWLIFNSDSRDLSFAYLAYYFIPQSKRTEERASQQEKEDDS